MSNTELEEKVINLQNEILNKNKMITVQFEKIEELKKENTAFIGLLPRDEVVCVFKRLKKK